jgi:hypothetical protein
MIASWLAFPALLLALSLGAGLLVERLFGRRLPGSLLVPVGLAAIVVIAHVAVVSDATAELAPAAAIALAAAGFVLAPAWRRGHVDPSPALAGLAVFLAYGAPVLASGEATFAGYIKLDDSATWMALTDRVMEHGRSLEGLPPSTYEATLDFNLDEGYPVGAFLPLGVGAALTGVDVAWLVQPYIAFWAAMLAAALFGLLRPLIGRSWLAAAAAAIAAQPALLYGYALWGGIKEVAAAALVATAAALLPLAFERRPGWRAAIPAAVAISALAAVLSPGGLVWIAPALAAAVILALRAGGTRAALSRLAALGAAAAALAAPLATGALLPPTSAPLTADDARGNLVAPLEPAQVAGIWPAADFRFSPQLAEVAYVLVLLVAVAAALGIALAWRSGARGLALYGGGTLIACAVVAVPGSPWVDAKAFAIGSPAAVALAVGGVAAMLAGKRLPLPRRIAGTPVAAAVGGVALGAIAAGVIWSNVLAYGGVSLAPRGQLEELERIGEQIAGEAPTLITEYQPYGARHFLRDAAPEAVSELRRRRIPLAGGGVVEKGLSADTDELDWDGLSVYRTLVVRRSPTQSRPPSSYRLAWQGEWYEVWAREDGAAASIVERLGLGSEFSPIARPARCRQVRALAEAAGKRGELRYARRAAPMSLPLGASGHPDAWGEADGGAALLAVGEGAARTTVALSRTGRWEPWLRGSVRGELAVTLGGEPVDPVRHLLNNEGQYVHLESVELERGRQRVELRHGGPDLHPGSAGTPAEIGPMILAPAGSTASRVETIGVDRYRELCHRRLDWVEAVLPGAAA